jgi:hypothetical protein
VRILDFAVVTDFAGLEGDGSDEFYPMKAVTT